MSVEYAVRLRFEGPHNADAGAVADALQILARARRRAEVRMLLSLREQESDDRFDPPSPDLPDFDSIMAASETKRLPSSVRVVSTEEGSLEIVAILAVPSWWLLQNTLGATFKDAWTTTEAHRRIKQLLARNVDKDIAAFVKELRRGFGRMARASLLTIQINNGDDRREIVVTLQENREGPRSILYGELEVDE